MPTTIISQPTIEEEGHSYTGNERTANTSRPIRRTFSREHQSQAGKALVAKRGRSYMAQIGRRGYAVTKSRYPDFHIRGGQAAWRKQNRLMLDEGYFPNQSPTWWNYCQVQGCHQSRMGESAYCFSHSKLDLEK